MINKKKINAYMDLVNVIVKKAGDKWIIDTADSGPDPFTSDEELMEYINYELREIEAIYTANGELDDLQKIYEENGLELNSKEARAEQIDAGQLVKAVRSEYTWIYDAEDEGRTFDYTPALDRFEDLKPWEKILLDKYITEAQDLIVSDREVLAFISTIDKGNF